MAQPVRRVCAGSREPLPEAPRLGRFASVRARGCVRAPAPGTGSRDQARSEQSQARSSRPRGPREGSSRPGGRQGLAKRADRSQAGRLVMEEQRVSGQPSPESQAPPRSRESRGRRAAGSTSQTQNPVGSRARVPGAPARGARPPLHPEVCPSLIGPIVLPRFLSPPPPPRAPPPQLRLGPLLPLPPSCPPYLLPGAPSFLPPSLLSSLLLSPTLSFSRTHADTSSLFALSPLGLPLSPAFFLFHFCRPCNLLKCCPFAVIRQTPRRGPPHARPLPPSPAFCLSRSLSPPPICYTETPVNDCIESRLRRELPLRFTLDFQAFFPY